MYANITRGNPTELRDIFVYEALWLRRWVRRGGKDEELAMVNILFPRMMENDFAVMETAHRMSKTTLIDAA